MADDITVRLNGDNSNYRSSMSDAVDATGNAVSKIEEHLLGTRAIATAVGTALGLHLSTIADNLARLVIGFSTEEEEALKHLDEATAKSAQLVADLGFKRLSSAKQEESLTQDIAALWKQSFAVQGKNIADSQAQQTDIYNQITEKEEKLRDLKQKDADAQQKSQDDFNKKSEAAENSDLENAQKIFEENLKSEDINQQIADLKQKISDVTGALEAPLIDQTEKESLLRDLEQDKVTLNQTELELKKQQDKQEEVNIVSIEHAADAEKNVTAELEKQAKLKTEINAKAGAVATYDADGNITGYTVDNKTPGSGGKVAGNDLGVLQQVGGIVTYNDPAQQSQYEANLKSSTISQITDEIAGYQARIDQLRQSGSSYGPAIIPTLNSDIDTLRGRINNVDSYLFGANYSDSLGPGLLAEQLQMTAKNTDQLKAISDQLGANGFPVGGG